MSGKRSVKSKNQSKMAHMQYLIFNNENIPMPASYSVSLSDVEADSGGVTEAGTTEGCCPGRRGSDRRDLPCIKTMAE